MRIVTWRWAAVAAGVAALVALPPVVGALPARQDGVATAELLARVDRSDTRGYSGYVEALGGLALPRTDVLSSVTDLLGDRTRLRVWWRGEEDWRVDTVQAGGESGLHVGADGAWTWDYERNTATLTSEPPVRLPRAADLDPAAAINVFSPVIPPEELAGLPLRARVDGLGSVGTYGTGLTVLVAVPLPGRISGPLSDQLARTPGVTVNGSAPRRLPDGSVVVPDDATLRLAVGPLTLLLADPPEGRSWLLTGTVTAATLDKAAAQIAADPPLEVDR